MHTWWFELGAWFREQFKTMFCPLFDGPVTFADFLSCHHWLEELIQLRQLLFLVILLFALFSITLQIKQNTLQTFGTLAWVFKLKIKHWNQRHNHYRSRIRSTLDLLGHSFDKLLLFSSLFVFQSKGFILPETIESHRNNDIIILKTAHIKTNRLHNQMIKHNRTACDAYKIRPKLTVILFQANSSIKR